MNPRILFFILIFSGLFHVPGLGQRLETKYPRTVETTSDSFSISFSNYPQWVNRYRVGNPDTIGPGTDGAVGLYAKIYSGKDSTRIDYTNMPYEQVNWINIESPKGKTVFRLHFNQVNAAFSLDYIRKHRGTLEFEVPEVFELANIIWTLSPAGQRADNLHKEGNYFQAVRDYFKPFLDHPLFKNLDMDADHAMNSYYDFRENSFPFEFRGDKIIDAGPYYYVQGNDREFKSLFSKLLPLIEDFAVKSRFRDFYSNHQRYYDSLKFQEGRLMPIRQMWGWLEKNFPKTKMDAYKVIFSPLIGASHSTQNFGSYQEGWYWEAVMFVGGPGLFDYDQGLTTKQREGLASGIVFTEIDHNYVNPAGYPYAKLIDSIFSNRSVWAAEGGDTKMYDQPMEVFNEYMTHAVFCLYVAETYDPATADFVIKKREALMVEHRHYIRFKEFNQALKTLSDQRKGEPIVNLFPDILSWCKAQH